MALILFTQKNVENIDVNDIPEEFVNYFDDLNDNEKQRIYEFRPELAIALGYKKNIADNTEQDIDEPGLSDIDESPQKELLQNHGKEDATITDISRISVNIYDGKNLREMAKSELDPLEMLTIREDQEKCKIHKTRFEDLTITYLVPNETKPGNYSNYGVAPKYCKECNRLFIFEGRAETIINKLSNINKSVHIYSLKETDAYVRSQLKEIELTEGESIYIPDEWRDDSPSCTIHHEKLEEYLYTITYDNRKVSFNAYFCEKCSKIMLRRVKALDLQDRCAETGVPMPKIEPLVQKVKKSVPKEKINPDYYIEDGKRVEYSGGYPSDVIILEEADTAVISDSIYCELTEHITEPVITMFTLSGKRDGRKHYLCQMGYCQQCQKYYMAESDFKVIYPIGRPELTVIYDTGDSEYQITSGEIFELENQHLQSLECDLRGKTNEIYNAEDFVNPYDTIKGGYDDGGLKFSKDQSEYKYRLQLDKWNSLMPQPYTYRVDLSCDGSNLSYYLGPSDIEIDGEIRVISYNDTDFGRQLVNYRTIEIDLSGKTYKVKLSRQFDIENSKLFGYVNLRTDEDIIFGNRITDPLLIKVLNLRKRQHNLIDIIATIQENQNAIVDEKFNQNIVVQGCAGSGKTMVLLHRLSALKYNHPEFDFSQSLILTPNENFNLHIKGIIESLQIGYVNRLSVEQYYIDMLKEFSSEFVPGNELSSEVAVNQTYVDFIYSDEFKQVFKTEYESVIKERKAVFSQLSLLCEKTEEKYPESFGTNDSDFMKTVNMTIGRVSDKVRAREREAAAAEKTYQETANRLSETEKRIPVAEENIKTSFIESVPKVYAKLGTYMSGIQHEIDEQKELVDSISQEAMRVENQLLPFGKKSKLADLKRKSDKASEIVRIGELKIEEAKLLSENQVTDKPEDEIMGWMREVILVVPEVREELRYCELSKKTLSDLQKKRGDLSENLVAQKQQYETARLNMFPDEITSILNQLKARAADYTDYLTFCQIFDRTVAGIRDANKIKNVKGIHRYDLYTGLLFCIDYYGKLPKPIHFICVDEGQDLSINEYRLIYKLNGGDTILNIFGDTNQLLKPGRGISDWKIMEDEFKLKKFLLNENYRNTNQITRYCNYNFDMKVMQTGVDGPKVREIPRRDLEQELSQLKLNSDKTAILVSRNVRRSHYLTLDILPVDIKSAIGQKIDNGFISFMYVDEVKGIEFDKVFVVSNKMTRNEKYIAYTRALSELVIVVDETITNQSITEE